MRKGQMQDLGDLFVAIFLIAIIAFLFSMNSCSQKEKIDYRIDETKNVLENNLLLLNYLRIPIDEDGTKIIDIIYSISENDLKRYNKGICSDPNGKLFTATKEIFKDTTIRIDMFYADKNFCSISQQPGKFEEVRVAEAVIPTIYENKIIKIQLRKLY